MEKEIFAVVHVAVKFSFEDGYLEKRFQHIDELKAYVKKKAGKKS